MNVEMAILDALADDFEGLKQIETYLHFLGYEIQMDEITKKVDRLLENNLIYIVESISDHETTWYALTEKGKTLWHQSGEVSIRQSGDGSVIESSD